ncbi:MAG: STAS domain-containing protein [Alphaproteobacteria bacterium]|nr:STAS domain-containing protein [Alphaproteobacteria bacterium]
MLASPPGWIKTGAIEVRFSTTSSDHWEPQLTVDETPRAYWQGTAVGITLLGAEMTDFTSAMNAIISELEGVGPRFNDIRFFRSASEHVGANVLRVEPDSGSFALDRARAHRLSMEELRPLVTAGQPVAIDFSNVRTATQAFCYALTWSALHDQPRDVLSRVTFTACSSQVKTMLRMAVNEALSDAE